MTSGRGRPAAGGSRRRPATVAAFPDPGPCPGCGHTLPALLRSRRMGCAACYTVFATALEPLRMLLTGRGDPGGADADRWQQQREAAVAMQEAILTEDFERAAALRDTVRRLRGCSASRPCVLGPLDPGRQSRG